MREHWEEVWRFETARFVILGEIAPDDTQWDGEGPAPDCAPFLARVRVSLAEDEDSSLGESFLGGCYYDSPRDFFRVESWATEERQTRREIRRGLDHVRYLVRHRPTYRAQIARELAEVAKHRARLAEIRDHARRGVILCSYFADMVREAIADARRALQRMGDIAESMRA